MSTGVLPPPLANGRSPLRNGLLLSGIVHVALLAGVVFWSTRPEPIRPPVYRVNLVGAPPGARQAGVVDRTPPAPAESEKPTVSGAQQVAPPPKEVPTTKASRTPPPPAKATPTPAKSRTAGTRSATTAKNAAPPKAGAGKTGGKGADVINLRTEGIAFPDEGYLNNIVRQLSLAWTTKPQPGVLLAEVKFSIRRDGSVTGIEVVKSSGNRIFDIDAQGAIEAVGVNRRFGPLPAAWKDDVLIVYFTFDYALLK